MATRTVREHHAPVGALRPETLVGLLGVVGRQGAPRTCRCIETVPLNPDNKMITVREHHAPVGALKRSFPQIVTTSA